MDVTTEWRAWPDQALQKFLHRVCELPPTVVEGLVHDRNTAGGQRRIDEEVVRARARW